MRVTDNICIFLGRIRRDRFRGNSMQFEIDDVAVPPLAFGR